MFACFAKLNEKNANNALDETTSQCIICKVGSSHGRGKTSKIFTSTAGGRKSLFAPGTWRRARVLGARCLFLYLPPNLTCPNLT